jgi:hypothetical protein
MRNRRSHDRFELQDGRGFGFPGVEGLRIDDRRQWQEAAVFLQLSSQRGEVEPQIIGVEVPVAVDVLEGL